ncbi:hypothetical protein NE619_10320 [Anaerovorax odorimutans]|uniref:Uncharacterized protein n=1 Tax=Anaerovorax odorimutans TaxID=109327 RepID=A0ABT1RQG0_9FIRM|nr:hypothetical protein [Anaerovorax odorimutans]MCQ4637121.1 hypothetical protein [Anaerovorax odorimutans]
MNPLALLLLAAAAGGGRIPGMSGMSGGGAPIKLDAVLDQLHGAVNTLEKVSELSRMGSSLTGSVSLPAPASAHIPLPAEPVQEPDFAQQPAAPSLPNIDLQSAMQTLGPILSMLGGGQNSK